jgi:hypothetical protein
LNNRYSTIERAATCIDMTLLPKTRLSAASIANCGREKGKTHKMANATRTVIQFTAQLLPEQVLEIPINFTIMAASQKTISRQLRMTLALKLLHRENRAICSVSS